MAKKRRMVTVKGLGLALVKEIKWFFQGIWYVLKGIYLIIKWCVKLVLRIFGKEIVSVDKKNSKKKGKIIDVEAEESDLEENSVKEPKQGKKRHEPTKESFTKVETLKGDLKNFEKHLEESTSTIGIILGARGKGKSALGMKILENIKAETGRECFAMGFNHTKLPKWISVVEDMKSIENGGLVLIDEGGILFSSRNAMTNANKVLSELLLVARHKDLSIIFITQNSSNLELNAIRQADYMLLKPSSLLQADFERKKIKDMYSEVAHLFEKHKNKKGLTYIYSDKYKGFVENKLPTFWNAGVSKSFS